MFLPFLFLPVYNLYILGLDPVLLIYCPVYLSKKKIIAIFYRKERRSNFKSFMACLVLVFENYS